jgi:hypothetical protein
MAFADPGGGVVLNSETIQGAGYHMVTKTRIQAECNGDNKQARKSQRVQQGFLNHHV